MHGLMQRYRHRNPKGPQLSDGPQERGMGVGEGIIRPGR
jgi:hypothetical protein